MAEAEPEESKAPQPPQEQEALHIRQQRQNRLNFATRPNSMVCRRMTSIMDRMMSACAKLTHGMAG